MIRVDDRTEAERTTHVYGVVARDKFMSGWGGAKNGISRCAWACAPDANLAKLEAWVRSRKEMSYVYVVNVRYYEPPRNTAHFHIYTCEKDHPSQE